LEQGAPLRLRPCGTYAGAGSSANPPPCPCPALRADPEARQSHRRDTGVTLRGLAMAGLQAEGLGALTFSAWRAHLTYRWPIRVPSDTKWWDWTVLHRQLVSRQDPPRRTRPLFVDLPLSCRALSPRTSPSTGTYRYELDATGDRIAFLLAL